MEEIKVSEFKVCIIKYLSDGTPVVVYETTEPAEIYTIPNRYFKPLIKEG